MKKRKFRRGTPVLGGLLVAFVALIGCETDSPEGIVRNVGLIVQGFYRHSDSGSTLVSQASGGTVNSLDLRQSGDQLEGIDNNGTVFRGSIGQVVDGSTASFTMDGSSPAGNPATMSGTISVSGTQATMSGTWIEDSLFGTIHGVATVPTNAPPPSSGSLTISPQAATIPVNVDRTFTVSGGDPPYDWTVTTPTIGTITRSSGSEATYRAITVGVNTIIVADNDRRNTTQTTVESFAPSTP